MAVAIVAIGVVSGLAAYGVRRFIAGRLDYLPLEVTDQQYEEFFRQFSTHYGERCLRSGVRGSLDLLVATFLQSTDLFQRAADHQPVRYVRFFHPYASPCWNPMSRP